MKFLLTLSLVVNLVPKPPPKDIVIDRQTAETIRVYLLEDRPRLQALEAWKESTLKQRPNPIREPQQSQEVPWLPEVRK